MANKLLSARAAPVAAAATTRILTSAMNLPVGTKIESRHVTTIVMIPGQEPPGTFHDLKEIDGKVTMDKWEKPTQHGAWTGVAAGAVVGILFPPSILGMAALGGVAGGLIGHFHGGMSRKDLHELGELLDTGDALLIVIGRDKLSEKLEKAGLKAQKQVEKEVKMDGEELDRQLAEAEKELAKS